MEPVDRACAEPRGGDKRPASGFDRSEYTPDDRYAKLIYPEDRRRGAGARHSIVVGAEHPGAGLQPVRQMPESPHGLVQSCH